MTSSGPPTSSPIADILLSTRKVHALHAAIELDLPDLLADKALAVEELAARTGTHARSLHRLLRALASFGIMTEAKPGVFASTELGAQLQRGGSHRALILMHGSDWHREAWRHFRFSLETGQSGMLKAFGIPAFDYLSRNPEQRAIFDEAMRNRRPGAFESIARAYDFSQFHSIVDVGGGPGSLLAAILQVHPKVSGVLFELDDCLPVARQLIESKGLSGRCNTVAGDFFAGVPSGHDAYILCHVLHDWNDDKCAEILTNCRLAMGPDAKLLVIEAIIPEGDAPHPAKLIDLHMLVIEGGVERTEAEFDQLLGANGFQLSRIVSTAVHQNVIEAELAQPKVSAGGRANSANG